MTLVQVIVFVIALVILVAIVRYWIVDLGFPGSLINATKPYECEVCHKKYWSSRKAFRCCEGTPEYDAWRREMNRRYHSGPHSPTERDCPRCKGKAGNYTCPLCDGRGKTYIQ